MVFEKEMGVMHAVIEMIFDINGNQWCEHKRQETEGIFPKSTSWQMYLAGDPSPEEGGALRRLRAVERRVGVNVDGVEPGVALEELLPQRSHRQVPPRQEQERHLRGRAGWRLPQRRRRPRQQLLVVDDAKTGAVAGDAGARRLRFLDASRSQR
jgi:hypothetical protein